MSPKMTDAQCLGIPPPCLAFCPVQFVEGYPPEASTGFQFAFGDAKPDDRALPMGASQQGGLGPLLAHTAHDGLEQTQ
jgi:hypothetical protein